MKTKIIPILCVMSCVLFSIKGRAQDQKDSQNEEHEEIILKKDGTFPKDLTIHIQGDEITINGKTPDNISIIRKKTSGNELSEHSFSSSGNMPHSFSRSFPFGNPENSRALLGVLTKPDDSSEGAQIAEVEKGTPADSAGLKKGDIITKVDNQTISTPQDLSQTIKNFNPGDQVTITYQRNGQTDKATVTLGRFDNWQNMGPSAPAFGFRGNSRHPDMNGMMEWFRNHHPGVNRDPHLRLFNNQKPQLGLIVENHSGKGANIIRVYPGTPAQKAGFQPDDVVTSFGGEKISSVEDLQKAVKENYGKDHIQSTVERDNKSVTLHVSLPELHESTSL